MADASPTTKYPDTIKRLPNLAGKTVAVTGCTSGVGFSFAKGAAELGATVVMLNRPSPRADGALAALKRAVPRGSFVQIPCDLLSFKSVRAAGERLKAACPSGLDVLCNNAGLMFTANAATEDGFNAEIQTNHLSHFLLASVAWPLLEKAADARGDARILHTISKGRKASFLLQSHTGIVGEYFAPGTAHLGGDGFLSRFLRYNQSKLANAVFTIALASKQSKVKALCGDPGISASNLVNVMGASGADQDFLTRRFVSAFADGWMAQSQDDGACGMLLAAFLPEAASGEMWGPILPWGADVCTKVETDFWFARSAKIAVDTLWEASVRATGAEFPEWK